MPGEAVKTSLGLKPTFIFLYEFGGKAAATSTKCKDFELEKHESEALAQQSDDLMAEFFPSVQSRWVKLVIFIGSVLGIFGKKYLSYLEQVKKEKPIVTTAEPKKENEVAVDNTPKVFQLGEAAPVNPNKRF